MYLRHINLHAVYEQLPKYELGDVSPTLANIPPTLCDPLATHFGFLAAFTADSLEGSADWEKWASDDIAAEVSDLIESELEALGDLIESDSERFACTPTCHAPLVGSAELGPGDSLESFLCFAARAAEVEGADYSMLTCLLVYQYDALCSLYTRGHMASVLAVFESIAETRESITHSLGRDIKELRLSQEARLRAEKRHAPTNQQKSRLLAEWEATASSYESRADFARIVSQRERLKYRTLYDWIAAHDRPKT
ncbi:hypothetical protein P9K38_19360 [Pseudomonas sp. 905_Psudmo1]|nr:hypothetical protein [Pseudomonas sp. 905_Psudmo1]WFS17587.1 hypothetical protein P9K38_19360 [Pseudomonas sp. 905_Psudmo1]